MRARAAVLVAGLLLAGSGVVPGSADAGCAARVGSRTGLTGTWASYDVPAFSAGPLASTAHAVDPADPQRWWVTNGVQVSRSTDGGCSWHALFTLPVTPTPETPVNRQTDRIRALAGAGGQLYAAVETAATLPRVGITIDDEDATATDSTVVLAGVDTLTATAALAFPAGAPGPLAVAPSNPLQVYAVAHGLLNVSQDGGRSWQLGALPPSSNVQASTGGASFNGQPYPPLRRVVVDPLRPKAIWVASESTVWGSTDAASTYIELLDDPYPGTLPVLAAAHVRDSAVRVTVAEQKSATAPVRGLRVSDDGVRFHQLSATSGGIGVVRGSGQSMAAGPGRTDLVFTTSDPTGRLAGVYVIVGSPGRVLSVDEFGLGPLQDVQTAGTAYAFRTSNHLVRWTPDRQGLLRLAPVSVSVPPLRIPPIGPGLPPLSALTRLTAPVTRVQLAPGASADVPLALTLRPEPTPLDVFFLLDTSGSMDDVVRGLAAGFAQVARELGKARIDAHFGLGDYQDSGDMRYRRLVDISAPGEPLRQALESIRTRGGAEPAYTALDQMSRGTGIPHPSTGKPVAAGQDAHWRPGSLRIVVNATDEVPSQDPDGATRDDAIDAMNADHVRHIGVEVVRDSLPTDVSDTERGVLGPGAVHADLVRLSRGTGSLAPVGGIDCDGNGRLDVKGGDPLVCPLRPGDGRVELAGPLQRVLSTIEDVQAVGVVVQNAVDARALSATATPLEDTSRVDVKVAHQLGFSVHVACGGEALGTTRLLHLRPLVGSRLGNALPLEVECQGLPVPPPPVEEVLVPERPPVLAAALPLPPPPVAPVGAPAPAAAPAAMPAAAPAAAPAPGIALAPQEVQAQLELARQEAGDSEMAMVNRRDDPDLLALRLLAMTSLCAAATAVALRRRTSAQLAVRDVRRRGDS